MPKKIPITQAMLFDIMIYSPITGEIIWKETGARKKRTEDWCEGRKAISLFGRTRRAHDIIWCYVTGDWPTVCMTYKDGDSSNLRFANLKLSKRSKQRRAPTAPILAREDRARRNPNSIKVGTWEDAHYRCPPATDLTPQQIFGENA